MMHTFTASHSLVRDETKRQEDIVAIFGCLWAIFTAFHMESFIKRHHSFDDFILIMTAAFFLSKPSSLFRFMMLITFQCYVIAVNQPFVPNHWLLAGFVDLTIIVAYLIITVKQKSFQVDKVELYKIFAPIVRVQLLILYFYVVFHKLNYDFLNPASSCGSVFYSAQSDLSLLPPSQFMTNANIYLTLFIEALIPILLCFRRTVLLGVFVGVVFHSIIGFNPLQPFYDISSSIFALYFLFLPGHVVEEVTNYWKNTRFVHNITQFRYLTYSSKVLITGGLIAVIGFIILFLLNSLFIHFFRYILWSLYCVLCIGFIVTALLLDQKKWTFQNMFSSTYPILWLIPVIVFINGASPYLGLKTDSAFAMFSNLRTEGGVTNHLFVPVSTQIFDFQKDMVEIISSSDPKLQRLADDQKLIAFFELRRHVGSNQSASISYIRHNKRVDVADTKNSTEFAQPLPFWQKRLLQFRVISKNPVQPCAH